MLNLDPRDLSYCGSGSLLTIIPIQVKPNRLPGTGRFRAAAPLLTAVPRLAPSSSSTLQSGHTAAAAAAAVGQLVPSGRLPLIRGRGQLLNTFQW